MGYRILAFCLSTIESWDRISPDVGVVVTTDKVSDEATKFLKAGELPGHAEPTLVQGSIADIRKSILKLLDSTTSRYFESRMVPLS